MSNKAEAPLILSLDIGTSSTRAMLFDARARAVAGCAAQTPNRLRTTAGGGAEFEPIALFEGATATIDRLLEQAGPLAGRIGGVAVDTLVSNVMGVDSAGRPITPLFTYADTRNAPDARRLRQKFAGELAEIHRRTGCPVHSAYLPARLRWLARTRPDIFNAAARWVSIADYLYRQFFGRWLTSVSVAAWTGLLNPHTLRWDAGWLARLPLDESRLPPLVDAAEPQTGLRPEWAARWPALKDIPWFPAIGDGAAANLGSGCDTPARIALTVGTSAAMRVTLPFDLPAVPAGLWLYRIDSRRTLLGGATTEGGNLFAWLGRTLQLPSPAELETALAQLPPAGHGLAMLPFIGGERAPGWRDDARASLIGFTQNTRPVEIVRAALESVAYRFALIYRLMAPHLPPEPQIIAGGGALLNSPAWRQIIADALGLPITVLAEPEATGRGAALLALESLGVIAATADLPPATGQTCRPNPAHHARYREAIEQQSSLYRRLIAGN